MIDVAVAKRRKDSISACMQHETLLVIGDYRILFINIISYLAIDAKHSFAITKFSGLQLSSCSYWKPDVSEPFRSNPHDGSLLEHAQVIWP